MLASRLYNRTPAYIDEVSSWIIGWGPTCCSWIRRRLRSCGAHLFHASQHHIPTTPVLPARCRFLLSATLVCSSTATLCGRTSPPLDCVWQHFGSYGTERPALSATARFTITCLCFRHQQGRLLLQSANAAPLHSFSQRGALSTSPPFPRSSLIVGLGKDQLSPMRPCVPLSQRHDTVSYLAESIRPIPPPLRSSNTTTLIVPSTQWSTWGDRAYRRFAGVEQPDSPCSGCALTDHFSSRAEEIPIQIELLWLLSRLRQALCAVILTQHMWCVFSLTVKCLCSVLVTV